MSTEAKRTDKLLLGASIFGVVVGLVMLAAILVVAGDRAGVVAPAFLGGSYFSMGLIGIFASKRRA